MSRLAQPPWSPAARISARLGVVTLALGAIAILAGFFFGETYIPRLPQHRGYYLVSVDDAVHAVAPPRPRRAVVVVVDGLRMESAIAMKTVAVLRRHGQCRVMDVGPLTVSRPVYAIPVGAGEWWIGTYSLARPATKKPR